MFLAIASTRYRGISVAGRAAPSSITAATLTTAVVVFKVRAGHDKRVYVVSRAAVPNSNTSLFARRRQRRRPPRRPCRSRDVRPDRPSSTARATPANRRCISPTWSRIFRDRVRRPPTAVGRCRTSGTAVSTRSPGRTRNVCVCLLIVSPYATTFCCVQAVVDVVRLPSPSWTRRSTCRRRPPSFRSPSTEFRANTRFLLIRTDKRWGGGHPAL